ncbi:cysteinyl leukotriene receptor 2-like [Chanos chanos]|uniref:Cysteinyl leukotriene receptor 2-like n=1 Tax=Chanos chanos TaxID=29144 RepID=A0A6J2VRU8_CHACN|nr:cysteinyl leukotriene receptor 2-like [Chanos chanos]
MDRAIDNDSWVPRCNHSDEYKFTTYNVVYGLVFIFGLLGNTGALFVFCKLSVKNRLSTIFLIHLAASDLLFILTLPFRIAFNVSQGLANSDAKAQAGSTTSYLGLACRVSTFVFYISMYCSIYFLTALSVSRYLVLAGRVRLQNSEACRLARMLCIAIWVFVLGGMIIYLASTSGFNIQAQGCFEPTGESWELLYHINLVVLVLGFALPLVVVLLSYALMIRHILQMQAGQRQRDVALVCLVLAVFCICFLPYHIQRTLHLYYMVHPPQDPCSQMAILQKTVVITLCFAAANSCLDPLIFLFVGHGFIPVMKKLMAQNWWLRRKAFNSEENSFSVSSSPAPTQLKLLKTADRSEPID